MSVSTSESAVKRARSELENARKKQAAEDKKCADAEKAASAKLRSASSTSSESSARSYLREAERKRDEADRARSAAATLSGRVADAQSKVHRAEADLEKARAAEQKKRDQDAERERKRREENERRQREQASRAAKQAERERARTEQDRDARIDHLGAGLLGVRGDVDETRAFVEARPWEVAPAKITVLILTAEPDGQERLRIDRELREIQQQVRATELRDSITFEHRHAVRFTDLIQHLNETEPDVIHFSGHGSSGGIALHADDDATKDLSNEALDRLLEVAPKPLKLVVFNSCDSAAQAQVAVHHAAAAIGMNEPIGDEAARVFAGQLYNSLGFGRSLGLAVRQATLAVEMKLDETSGEPTLMVADDVDPDQLLVVDPN